MRATFIVMLLTATTAAAYELKTDHDGDVVRWKTAVHFVVDTKLDEKLHAKGAVDAVKAAVETWKFMLPESTITVEAGDVAALAVHLMTNTALTGATFDIDGGQQIVPA